MDLLYLNTRYYRFPENVRVRAREGWEYPRDDKDRNLLRTIQGQRAYLESHKDGVGGGQSRHRGSSLVDLEDEGALSQNSGWVNSAGHMAALYRDELYEMLAGRGGVARLQQFGVVFGYRQVVLYIEPTPSDDHMVTANTARTHLIVNSEPLPWADWAAEFARRCPRNHRADGVDCRWGHVIGSQEGDSGPTPRDPRPVQVRSYRPTPTGDKIVDPARRRSAALPQPRTARGRAVVLAGAAEVAARETSRAVPRGGGCEGGGGRRHNEPDVKWVTVAEGTRAPEFWKTVPRSFCRR